MEKDLWVRKHTPRAPSRWQTPTDEEIGQDQKHEKDEALDSRGPTPADFRKERIEEQRKDDSAEGSAYGRNPRGVAALGEEEVADGCRRGSHDERRSGATEDAEHQQKLIVLWQLVRGGLQGAMCQGRVHTRADAHEHDTGQHQDATGQDEQFRPSSVEYRADLDPAEKREKDVNAPYPSESAGAVVRQLVSGQVGVVRADGVHVAIT